MLAFPSASAVAVAPRAKGGAASSAGCLSRAAAATSTSTPCYRSSGIHTAPLRRPQHLFGSSSSSSSSSGSSSSSSSSSSSGGSRRGDLLEARATPPPPPPPEPSSSIFLDPDEAWDPPQRPPERDDYADWKNAKDDETEAFKRAARAEGGGFKVGAKPLDENMLSQVMLQLLQNHKRGIPAAALLMKVKDDMCLDGYKSVLVGIGRTRQWALAREVVEWVRAQGIEQGERNSEVLTSNWFVALIKRRVDDREWEPAIEVFEYMRDLGGKPSGECIEMFALITDHESSMNAMSVRKLRSLGEWLSSSDAGKVLWHLSFGTPGMAAPDQVKPSKVVRIAMPSEEFDINGDIDKLREQFKEYLK